MNGAVEAGQEAAAEMASVISPVEAQIDHEKVVARLGAIAEAIQAYTKRSIQQTNPKDWIKIGNGYYLQASGAQKIRPIWGCYYRNRSVVKEIFEDGSYGYWVTGDIGSQVLDKLYFGKEIVVEIEGGRNSKDPFFTKGGRTPDPFDVKKSSVANWEARAITALLGLKNMSAEDLQRNGINPAEVKTVEYQAGAEGGGQTGLISEAQRKRLFAIASSQNVSEATLKTYLKSKYGLDSTGQITRKDYDVIVAWAQAGGQTAPARNA